MIALKPVVFHRMLLFGVSHSLRNTVFSALKQFPYEKTIHQKQWSNCFSSLEFGFYAEHHAVEAVGHGEGGHGVVDGVVGVVGDIHADDGGSGDEGGDADAGVSCGVVGEEAVEEDEEGGGAVEDEAYEAVVTLLLEEVGVDNFNAIENFMKTGIKRILQVASPTARQFMTFIKMLLTVFPHTLPSITVNIIHRYSRFLKLLKCYRIFLSEHFLVEGWYEEHSEDTGDEDRGDDGEGFNTPLNERNRHYGDKRTHDTGSEYPDEAWYNEKDGKCEVFLFILTISLKEQDK